MKQFYLFIALIFSVGILTAQQVPKKVFFEEFTGASCPPCAVTNPIFDALLEANHGKVHILKYQINIPGADVMYSQNQTDVNVRRAYYNVNSAPNCRMNGTIHGPNQGHPLDVTQGVIDQQSSALTDIELKIDHNLVNDNDSVSFEVSVKNVGANTITGKNKLHIALIEKSIEFPNTPNTNGELVFNYVMRKMVPSAAGTSINDLAAGETKTFTYKIVRPTYIYNFSKLGAICFVQDSTSKQVLQAEESSPKTLTGTHTDAGLEVFVEAQENLCDTAVEIKAIISNNGTTDITTATIEVKLGTATVGTANLPSRLAPGNKTRELVVGTAKISRGIYSTLTANLKLGTNPPNESDKLNNIMKNRQFSAIRVNPFTKELKSTFEVSQWGRVPLNTYFENFTGNNLNLSTVDAAALGAQGFDVGGFGQSRFSTLYYFVNQPVNGTKTAIYYDKIDLSQSKNSTLSFSHSYSGFDDLSSDALRVLYSLDCGSTWTEVWKKQGKELATAIPTSEFYIPTPDSWIQNKLAIKELDGQAEVLLRVEGIAGGDGNNLYIDDVNLGPDNSVGNKDFDHSIFAQINYLNTPFNFMLNVNSDRNQLLDIQIFDVTGKPVTLINKINLLNGLNQIPLNQESAAGLYFVRLNTEHGSTSLPFVIK